jgi:hypothetical protein
MKTLRDVMPDLFSGSFDDVPAYKLGDVAVVSEHGLCRDGTGRWPGQHKNVYFWVALANGKAVGWNENPSRGWSFPVITLKGK